MLKKGPGQAAGPFAVHSRNTVHPVASLTLGGPFQPGGSFERIVPGGQPTPTRPLFVASGPEVSFGEVTLGTPSQRTLVLANLGGAPLIPLHLSMAPPSQEIRYVGGDCGGVLLPGAYCSVSLEFRPTREGERRHVIRAAALFPDGSTGAVFRNVRGQGVERPHRVAMGQHHACATLDGDVKCWGDNSQGQLGDGTRTDSLVPEPVVGLNAEATQVAAGRLHVCAIAGGGVWCWGYNGYGQLGNGSTHRSEVPVAATGLEGGVTALSTSDDHTCAVHDGAAKCWGDNGYGQLGDNSRTRRWTPTPVYGLESGVSKVAAGGLHSCALLDSGAVKCWGYNGYGQLGDGSRSLRKTPVQVSGLEQGVRDIAAGKYHTCALKNNGAVLCWGYNGYGEVGDNSRSRRTTPVPVYGLSSGVERIALGLHHSCAVQGGALKCWGLNSNGQLGDGSRSQRLVPVATAGAKGEISSLTANGYSTCAVIQGGAHCWGVNSSGQLGNNSRDRQLTPFPVYPSYLYH